MNPKSHICCSNEELTALSEKYMLGIRFPGLHDRDKAKPDRMAKKDE